MLKWLGSLVDSNEKQIKHLEPVVQQINELEAEFQQLSDTALRAKTDEFKARIKQATAKVQEQLAEARGELDEAKKRLAQAQSEYDREEESNQVKRLQDKVTQLDKESQKVEADVLNELLPEAFAAVREAARRTNKQRHFDVQLIGGIVLHQGKIAEMKTGEGKTLVATLPLYLNSLTGRGCHLVTVNDYLARRDPYWMGPVFNALGVSVASIYPQQTPDDHTPSRLYDPAFDSGDRRWAHFRTISRKEAYQADITYGTSSEFGFDYLRDNMVIDLSQCVQRPSNYAIVDEVDNLLIDEARTPLIISAPDEEAEQKYHVFARLVPRLRPNADYTVAEKERAVSLTDSGISNVEQMLQHDGILKSPNLYDPENYGLVRFLDSALKAHVLYKKDREYVVKNGEVIIVDEFTGRLMVGRRYSEGLHQAIEAKEHVKIQRETKTFATVTIQNYFRMYAKLAGMTGTAATEAEEFYKIYKLDVIIIPTNKPMIREDPPDQIYKDEEAKFRAVVREIQQLNQQGRPVLVGTVSIERSEYLSNLLMRKGIAHQVLNAKQHEKEADIIAQAGLPGAVTVATNMAGRGVDIVLGGSPERMTPEEWQDKHNKVVSTGGLHIVGTERHEARRIDNQLRGRSGRQGDPGSSRFYVSFDDDIMKRFGGERMKGIMQWAGVDADTPIENVLVNRAIADVQKRVEGYHFDMRKHLVEYDDVVNKHREVIYGERKKILGGADLKANILNAVRQEIQAIIAGHSGHKEDYDRDEKAELTALLGEAGAIFPLPAELNAGSLASLKVQEIGERLIESAEKLYGQREQEFGAENMRILERLVMLRTMDNLWVEHLTNMEQMREGIGLEAVGQRDPLVAYKSRGHELFQTLLDTIQHDVAHTVYHVNIVKEQAPPPSPMTRVARGSTTVPKQASKVAGKKVGRNDHCPCGSGKKYKHCCGK